MFGPGLFTAKPGRASETARFACACPASHQPVSGLLAAATTCRVECRAFCGRREVSPRGAQGMLPGAARRVESSRQRGR